ncbi:MAG TPA: tripartite tricarboxylate transporter substrate binding protein [Acetobacteraceae bacterium]|jgi:tripartite-type tricarboxylate transporter receptor subunit TctC|nr:tripartite tricarboxylate transporter substrate binding protein [Acetobacteraceae bacterium]
MQRRHLLSLAAAGLVAPAIVRAQGAWPDKPIRMIVPWPPGGSTDTIARLFQARLGAVLGQPVVIENRGGASGSIGAAEAARAAPDGYTWMLQYDNEAPNQSLMRLPYRTLEHLAPVSLVATGPLVMVAHQSTPFRNFQEVIAAARREPDRWNYASSGVGGLAHISTTLLQQLGNFRLTHVPYRGGGPAVTAAVGGEVPLFMTNVVIVSQHIRAGTLRPLGVTTRTETRHVPNTPSFAQQGLGDFEAPTWWAFFGRAGTPAPIMERMHAALAQVLREPEVRARIEEQGCDVAASSPEECRRFVAAEIERWGQVIRQNNITADS